VGFKHFVGNGCGKVRRKCRSWACNLVSRGCSCVVVAHDLDWNDEPTLRAELESAVKSAQARAYVVLIPVREIESWLMCDADALQAAFRGRKRPRLPADPELLSDPKKELERLVWLTFRKQFLNTIHNAAIAKHIEPARLSPSNSFAPYPRFLHALRGRPPHRRRRKQ
jgi:hypothetical protein